MQEKVAQQIHEICQDISKDNLIFRKQTESCANSFRNLRVTSIAASAIAKGNPRIAN